MKISVIIPAKNEEKNIRPIYDKINSVLKKYDVECIFIDDGSTDESLNVLKALYKDNKNKMKIISFSRNFGKEAAIYAGLKNAMGDYITIIDCDMQQNPKYLKEMLELLESNKVYDQVAMVINNRKKNIFVKFSSKIFYKLINFLSDTKLVDGASDFRMFRSQVKDAIISMNENNRFSKGIFSWVGFNTKFLNYDVEDRKSGKTKYSFKNSLKLAIDGIIGFSTKPLRMATILGILVSIIAFIYFIYLVIKTLIIGIDVPGYASIMCIVLFLGGIQLITVGILGEYISRTFLEVKKRPIYISKEEIGFKD